jgi:DnaJ-class molecular chaperone
MARNFYLVLGVSEQESSEGIRHAFRELAMRYHPDRAGAQGTPFFQEIVEAYRVLSDPETRASYDEGRRHAGDVAPRRGPRTPVSSVEVEPLVPMRASLFRDFEVTRPSVDEVFQQLWRNFTQPWAPKSRRVDALDLELQLATDEAARGGVLTLGVPVFYPCRDCHGAGHVSMFVCRGCDGRGMAEEEEEVRLTIPAGVADGTLMQLPLRGLGIHNLYLRVLIRVGGRG